MWAYGNDDHSAVADARPLRESVYLARRMVGALEFHEKLLMRFSEQ